MREDNGASICNLSLTSPTNDQALYCAIRDSSMLFVAAAGNDGKDIDRTPVYPASYELDNVISAANIPAGENSTKAPTTAWNRWTWLRREAIS